ncbi:uncharacterized protein LOC127872681 [Dreissena polymorpha]|uniref:uncharacterized protein LOC127872681 n=1 Tax=Dreissena polymorpha TaxID=45954 RepID=UPI0022645F95|nr:uncharacterized protein LOC127872681 [Dreissena polymorpha]
MNIRASVSVIRIISLLVWLMFGAMSANNLQNTLFKKIPTNVTSSRVCRTAVTTTAASSKLSCLKRCTSKCMAVTFKQDSGECSLCNILGLVFSPTFGDLQAYEKEYRKEFIASDFTASWQYAHSHCNQYFDGLAIVLDQQDNDRLQEAITVGSNPSPQHWIGGSKVNSTWYWNTNEGDLVDFIWFNWGHGQPDAETCIRLTECDIRCKLIEFDEMCKLT